MARKDFVLLSVGSNHRKVALFRATKEDGFAFLRKSHGRANSPPDCLLGPAFRIHHPAARMHKKDQSRRIGLFCGGGGRIRTIEAKRSRFTVCPLWPLGKPSISVISDFMDYNTPPRKRQVFLHHKFHAFVNIAAP